MTPLRADEYEIDTSSFDHHDLSGWGGMETDYLRQELEEMQNKVDKYKDLMNLACIEMKQAQDDLKVGERRWEQKETEANNKLAVQLCHSVDLVAEYERIVKHYIRLTNTNLITNNILRLRKQGGFEV